MRGDDPVAAWGGTGVVERTQTMRVAAIQATSSTDSLISGSIERRETGPHDVLIKIVWAGVCHSDIHTVHEDWGPVPFPLTVGHEIAGIVQKIGPDVTRFALGDRVDGYLSLLAQDGTLVNVGAPSKPMSLHVQPLLGARRSYAGSATGSIAETQEMLDFCAEHGVAPEIEVISADQINEAWKRVLSSDVRYRFVIDMSTLS
jgi:D-arabinose 1-dehydrogenase-like Zn-dependent alcohol dehydrogenase